MQAILDAIIEYLPSPLDVPPVQGETPDGKIVERHADDPDAIRREVGVLVAGLRAALDGVKLDRT